MKKNETRIVVPKKYATLNRSERYHVFYGGRGSAKSHSIARYLICAALERPIKVLCTREMQNSISDSVHKLLCDVINGHDLDAYFNITRNEILACNGSSFIFKGLAHNVESVKSTEGVDICWVEEADKVSQNSWDVLIPTIRKPESRIIVTFNPTHEDDPVYQMFVVKDAPDAIVTRVNWEDNPHFPAVLKNEMEYMKRTDYEKYLHVWEGDTRTISDAQVFRGKFVVEDFSSDGVEAFYHGMDFGFAKDPSVIVRCFVSGPRLYIDRESYGHHVELTDLPKIINKTLAARNYKILADCARPETISFLKNMGYNMYGAKKWQGSVEDGIEFIKSFEKIVIHPTCVHTIEEFKRYSYKVDRHTNEILPIVMDDWNHCIDALRYGLDDMIKKKTTIYDIGVM
jgi:phage terminase large subunit